MADETQAETGGDAAGRIDVGVIRQLLDLMREHELAEIEIEQEDLAVRLRKGGPSVVPTAAPAPAEPRAAPPPAAEADEGLVRVTSPMVGTFYTASSPEAEAFVKVGDHIEEDTVVCMIEAMKVFNEIRAEVRGTIERILVENAQTVEFGQPLFAVRPD